MKVWFVTGAARGFGRSIVAAALKRGDRVAACARNPAELVAATGDNLLPLALDVTDRAHAMSAIAAAHKHFGRIDVLVNNAARGLIAAIEESTEHEVRDVIATNLLGALWVTQAAIPIMRNQGNGHILQISSGAGLISWPMTGVYQASKFGLEGFSEALAQETAALGIRVTLVEAGHMATEFGHSTKPEGATLDAYAGFRQQLAAGAQARKGADPDDLAARLMKVVDAEHPPLRILLGRTSDDVRAVYEERLKTWAAWSV